MVKREKARRSFSARWRRRIFLLLAAGCLLGGCLLIDARRARIRPPEGSRADRVTLETTGYCPCRTCCGWERNWYGRPVYSSGPLAGRPKEVGVTASGTRARRGTIAADTDVFRFGTVMDVPGYGLGAVEDRGAEIQGRKIDLFFSSHRQAQEWGRRTLTVTVWRSP